MFAFNKPMAARQRRAPLPPRLACLIRESSWLVLVAGALYLALVLFTFVPADPGWSGIDYVDTEPEAKAYLEKFDITYPNGPDLGTRISQAFRIAGVPETYTIDREGVLQHRQIGPFPSLESILAVVDPLLGQ